MQTVKAFFVTFSLHPQSIFSLNANTHYGIHSILKAGDNERFIRSHPQETRAESEWCIEILEAVLNVPKLGMLTLPDFDGEPPVFSPDIVSPVALTPLGALLTDDQIEAIFNFPTPDHVIGIRHCTRFFCC